MTEQLDATSVSTSTVVAASPSRAFQLFTAEIGGWWDADKHILKAPLAEMEFQPYVGGHIVDRGTDGSECRWARVLAFEPPDRVVFSWDIDVTWQIETNPELCSEVEITFVGLDQNTTRVTLTHRHLDRHGPGWESMRDAVSGGWSLAGFAALATTGPLPTIDDETMNQRLARAKPYTLAILHRTDALVRPDVDPIIWEHGRRNMALVEAGELSIVMPVSDDGGLAGIGIFVGDTDHVTTILDGDPGVRAGIFRYELHPTRGIPGAALG